MNLSQAGTDFIKRRECKDGVPNLFAYRCQAGVLTIGYGHTGDDVYEGQTITEDRAELLFDLDNDSAERAVSIACPKTTQAQFDAMVSLAFNVGNAGFKRSSVCRLHNKGQYAQAGQAFALWNKRRNPETGKLEESRGLTARRAMEAAMYLSDQIEDGYVPPAEAEGEQPMGASRSVKGQAIAGAGTAATVGSQLIPETVPTAPAPIAIPEPATVLDSGATVINQVEQTHSLVERSLAALQQNWWVFAVVAAVGIGYALYARHNDRSTGRS